MSDFTASNGMTVERDHNGDVLIDRDSPHISLFMKDGTALALDEFFQHERDAELGRWRYHENPTWVVYPSRPGFGAINGAELFVIDELAGASMEYSESLDAVGEYTDCDAYAAKVARAYLSAHPARKPWEDAEDGEIWVLTGAGGLEQPWRRANGKWRSVVNPDRMYDAVAAFDGHRIWPEDAS